MLDNAEVARLTTTRPMSTMPSGRPTAGILAASPSVFDAALQMACYFPSAAKAPHRHPSLVRWHCYERNEDEIVLIEQLQRSIADFECPAMQRQMAVTLSRAASSCSYSLDYALRSLRVERNWLMHGRKPLEPERGRAAVDLLELLREIPTLIEAVATDSKTAALRDAIGAAITVAKGQVRACVYTQFDSSVDYLRSALENRFGHVSALTSRMTFEERSLAAKDCAANNGILILTDAVTTEPPPAHLVVLYDLPSEPAILTARLSLFAKARGGVVPDVVAFEDTSRAFKLEVVEREAFKAGRPPAEADIRRAVFSNASQSA
jgi:hypothetical protein